MGEALSPPSALESAQHKLLQTPEETGSSWAALVGVAVAWGELSHFKGAVETP